MRWFELVVVAALGVSLSLVVCLLAVQFDYAGSGGALRALGDADVGAAMRLSFAVSTAAALLAAVFAVPAGYALSRWRFAAKPLVEGLLVIPILTSPMALGVSLLLIFRTGPGSWFEDHVCRFVFEVPGIVLAQFLVALSLETIVARSVFDGVPERFEQVARFLGCSPWAAFRRVTLPLARNGLLAAVVLGWARAIGDFGATSMIAGAVKGKTETMPVSIYLSMASVSLDRAVSLSIVLTVVTLLAQGAVLGLVKRGRP